jgi:pimeloyl-ACP methyl ester carboxylesterase
MPMAVECSVSTRCRSSGSRPACDPVHTAHYAGAGGLKLMADVWHGHRNLIILFIPGAGQTRRAWRRTAGGMAGQGYGVVSLDLRGHGESGWARDADYSIDAFVGDVRAVAAALPAPPVLVGASIGGIAALIAVGEATEPVAHAVVLVDVAPNMSEQGLDRIRAFMAAGTHGFETVDDAAQAIARYLPNRARARADQRGLAHYMRLAADGRYYWHWDPAFHASSKQRAAAGMLARMDTAARSVRIPTLLITGARSEVVSSEAALDLKRLIPGAQSVEIANAGHMVAGDENEVFDAAVVRFVDGLSPCHPSHV